MTSPQAITLRHEVQPSDLHGVRDLVAGTGFFNAAEIAIAEELVRERLERGAESGYDFVCAEDVRGLVGYACYGAIDGTESSYDLYWIAVRSEARGRGIGRQLLRAAEGAIAARGGRRVYVETASRQQYAPTRGFYERAGYDLVATLPDYYSEGDGKVIYCRVLPAVANDPAR